MPPNWQKRPAHRGGYEFYREGPDGSTLSVRQPHGPDGYWRMYWQGNPIVHDHNDRGIFETALEAVMALDALAADGMGTALLD